MASLSLSNKHLATPTKRQKAVHVTIATSSAIESIRAPFKHAKATDKTIKIARTVGVKRVQRASSV